MRWTAAGADAGVRLDKFLAAAERLGSRGRAADALERGKVFVNDVEMTVREASRPVVAGDDIRVWMDRPGSAHRRALRAPRQGELALIYEDDVMVAVNKPPALLTVPLPRRDELSVQDLLAEHYRTRGHRRPLVVHRIDRDTSGLVLFATRGDVQQRLKDQFRRREAERTYLAVVYGQPSPPEGTWRDHLMWDGEAMIQRQTHPRDPLAKEAVCEYRVVERFAETTLIEVRLVTGRRNQIRLQARLRGHMLVGEQRYVYGPQTLRTIDFPRQALHAFRLGVRHPLTGRRLELEAPLPEDFTQLLGWLRSNEG